MPDRDEIEKLAENCCRLLYSHVGGAWTNTFWREVLSNAQRQGWRIVAEDIFDNFVPRTVHEELKKELALWTSGQRGLGQDV